MNFRELYQGALPLDPEARRQFLDDHCEDPAVRAQVEKLLSDPPTATFIGKSAAASTYPGLSAGTLLAHYRIERQLGAGGMGLVYAATDELLRRNVAIKVLPPGHVDEDTRQRFLREAQAASALNHPNIVTVFEVGNADGVDFIAMERVAGRTLAQVIGHKRLDTRTAVQYAAQIAEALAVAHEANIVHRDLKPGNVMVTERGQVKVLDFGLAKRSAKMGTENTAELSLTEVGRVVGTAAYMSPEQAQGKPVDARSDVFSFGAVLYEMLAGAKAFTGDSGIATLAAVLNLEPQPLQDTVHDVPIGLRRILNKCLQKKPHDRWQHMGDVKLLLDDLLKDLDAPPPELHVEHKTRRVGWWAAAAAAAAGALGTFAIMRFARPPAPVPSAEPAFRLLTSDKGLNDYPAISKDGKFVAFASDRSGEGNLDIWLQQIGGREPIRLTSDPADETDPSFSPDGARIAFRSEKDGGGIYVAPALGGDPVLIASGGRNPRFSPDGRWIAYWTGRGEGSFTAGSRVYVIDAGGGQPRLMNPELGTAFFPVWSPRGDRLIVYGRKDENSPTDWWVVPFDNGAAVPAGVIAQLRAQRLAAIQPGLRVERAPLDWLNTGSDRILFAAPLADSANLWEIGLSAAGAVSGTARRLTSGPGRHAHGAWAQTDQADRLVFSDETLNYDIWTVPVEAAGGRAKGDMTRLTDTVSTEWAPSITADGRDILYVARRSANWALIVKNLPSGRERILVNSPLLLTNAQISGDGKRAVYSTTDYHLYAVPASGGTVERLCERCGTVLHLSYDGRDVAYEPLENEDILMYDTQAKATLKLAVRPGPDVLLSGTTFSPDGQWVAFHSGHHPTQTSRVWIARIDRSRPAPEADWVAVTDGKNFAQDPSWSEDGHTLYFVSERDGFRCFWGQRLDPATKKPVGEPFAFRHFHTARQSLRGASATGYLTGLALGGGRAVFAMPELTGSIWLEETPHAK